MFEGLAVQPGPIENADFVLCSGLFDDTTETPQDYQPLIAQMRARRLTMCTGRASWSIHARIDGAIRNGAAARGKTR